MKFVKISILSLTLGFVVTSCKNAGGENEKKIDTVYALPAPAPPTTPAPAADTAKKPEGESNVAEPAPAKK